MAIKLALRHIATAGFIALLSSNIYAANTLKMELQANKIVKAADGSVSYVETTDAIAGETVQYRAVYTNTTSQPINDVTVTLPIPANMTFTGKAYPNSAQASIDGNNYADIPLMRKVKNKVVAVPLTEYKALRWNIKWFPANKSVAVSLNAIVD